MPSLGSVHYDCSLILPGGQGLEKRLKDMPLFYNQKGNKKKNLNPLSSIRI